MAEMISSFQKGDLARAQELNARLLESYDFETGDARAFADAVVDRTA